MARENSFHTMMITIQNEQRSAPPEIPT